MSRHPIVLWGLVLAAAVGCDKSKLHEELMEDSTWETSAGEEEWESAERAKKRGDARDEIDGLVPRVTSGTISRGELVPVLDEGLGRFLQHVETEPVFHKGAFVGFRIVSLFPGEPAFASLDLRPGDTVTKVNGRPIERPEQAASVWESLRTASALVVDYQRAGQRLALRFAIVDEP